VKKELMVFGLMAIAAAACVSQPRETDLREPDMPTVTVMLPPGDVEAGRQAFLDLRCTACHAVPSESGFPAPASANPGPPIDARLASRDVSYLMASIMTPSHAISTNIGDKVRANLSGVLSPMGDFSRVMTVRQLVDLHAYVRSVK
jgi:mono/diheme cytochrome c family protein